MTVGAVRRARGVKGEVLIEDFTGGAFTPSVGQEVLVRGAAGERAATVERWRAAPGGVVAKFAGVDDRDGAERLRECEVAVAADALGPRPPGTYYEFELVGLPVETTTGEEAGGVTAVYDAGRHAVLTIKHGERSYDIPFVRAHVVAVRPGEKIVIVPYREE